MPGNDRRLLAQKEWLTSLPKDISTILDVGAGAGSHSAFFNSAGIKVTAIDTDVSNFRASVGVELVQADLFSWDDGRRFDAVFCSHVIEHAPNTARFVERLRHFVKDDGYLAIVVPAYEGLVCDEHWNIGWTCGQLAMTLVAVGFDCTAGRFQNLARNVCGWGRKRDFPPTEFSVAASAKYLPAGMAASIVASGEGNLHIPDLAYADERVGIPSSTRHVSPNENFRLSDAAVLRIEGEGRSDVIREFDELHDLSGESIRITVLHEGGPTVMRIAVASSHSDPFSDAAECYIGNVVGSTILEIRPRDFRTVSGKVDFSRIARVVIGGSGRDATLRCWAYAGARSLMRTTDGERWPENDPLPRPSQPQTAADLGAVAVNESRSYFLENRATRLDRTLSRLQLRYDTMAARLTGDGETPTVADLSDLLTAALRRTGDAGNAGARAEPEQPTHAGMADLLRLALDGLQAARSPRNDETPTVADMSDLLTVALRRTGDRASADPEQPTRADMADLLRLALDGLQAAGSPANDETPTVADISDLLTAALRRTGDARAGAVLEQPVPADLVDLLRLALMDKVRSARQNA